MKQCPFLLRGEGLGKICAQGQHWLTGIWAEWSVGQRLGGLRASEPRVLLSAWERNWWSGRVSLDVLTVRITAVPSFC